MVIQTYSNYPEEDFPEWISKIAALLYIIPLMRQRYT
jgi:hypothetical protein